MVDLQVAGRPQCVRDHRFQAGRRRISGDGEGVSVHLVRRGFTD